MLKMRSKRRLPAVPALLGALAVVLLLAGPTPARAAEKSTDGEVAITSPADGETIHGNTVDVYIELRDRGSQGNHVHIYLDGKLIKPLYGKKIAYTLRGLGRGKHKITIRLATKRHRVLEANDSVTVNVR